MSAPLPQKTRHLLKLYEDDLAFRYERKTGAAYLRRAQSFLDWLGARGVELSAVRTEDVHAYQSALYARRKKSGRPYSAEDLRAYRVSLRAARIRHGRRFATRALAARFDAVRRLYRFLYCRSLLRHDPGAVRELPARPGKKR
mgnify:CR=1 FL=1